MEKQTKKKKQHFFLILKVINLTLLQSYYKGEGAKVASFLSDWKKFNQNWILNIMFYPGV